jgi:hypothetical protein
MIAAVSGLSREFTSNVTKRGPHGMPSDRVGKSAARLYQKSSCTNIGILRNIQMKPAETSDISRDEPMRMSATTVPRMRERTIVMAVMPTLIPIPLMMRISKK